MKKLLLFFSIALFYATIPLYGQTNNCNDNAGGEIIPLTTCVLQNWDVQNNSQYWDGTGASCGESVEDDEWAWFDTPVGATNISITFNPDANNQDPVMTIFSGACATNMTPIDCADNGNDGDDESVSFVPTAGTRYRIRIQEYFSGDNMQGRMCVQYTAPAVVGDTPCDAITLPVNATCSYTSSTNVGMSNSGVGVDDCFTYNGDDVWFEMTVPASGGLTVTGEDNGGISDGAISIYDGPSCAIADMNELSCNDDANGGLHGEVSIIGTPGSTVWARYYSLSNSESGTFDICATEYTPTLGQNCVEGSTVCSDAVIAGNSNGTGTVADLDASNRGCLSSDERQSSWYFFQASSDGEVELDINTTVDYDFAIWGPYGATIPCPPGAAPIRCSYDGATGATGLVIGENENTDGAGAGTISKYVNALTVVAGESYILLINNHTADNTSFTLDWTMQNGASLDCSPLPVDISKFNVTKSNSANIVSWTTLSEVNVSHYEIQKMDNFKNFITIGQIAGNMNSSGATPYIYSDNRFESKINYYRIVEVDMDGNRTEYDPKSVNNTIESSNITSRHNVMGQEVTEDYVGIVLITLKDGTTIKTYQNKH